jgi:hypothetical protein
MSRASTTGYKEATTELLDRPGPFYGDNDAYLFKCDGTSSITARRSILD